MAKSNFLKRLQQSIIVLCLTLILTTSILVLGNRNNGPSEELEKLTLVESGISDFDYQKIFGQAPYQNSKYIHFKKDQYNVTYQFGNNLERTNEYPKGDQSHLMILGGSNTFGEGIDHNHDLGAILQSNFPDKSIYNLSYRGYSLNHALARCEHTPFEKMSPHQNGMMIYHHYHFHLHRFFGTLSFLRWSQGRAPKYVYTHNRFLYRNLFSDTTLNKIIIKMITHPWLIPITKKSINIMPLHQIDKYAVAVKQLKECYLNKYPKGQFVFAFSPFDEKGYYAADLKRSLKKYDIEFWQWDTISDQSLKQIDYHLNKKGIKHLASLFGEKIQSN